MAVDDVSRYELTGAARKETPSTKQCNLFPILISFVSSGEIVVIEALCCLIIVPYVGHDDVFIGSRLQQILKILLRYPVIIVKEGDILSFCLFQSDIPSIRHSSFIGLDEYDTESFR